MKKLTLSAALLAASFMLAVPAHAADAAAGKAKANDACADCHGDNGKGDSDNPSIAGMKADKFTAAMQEFRDGKRTKNKKMVTAAKKLSPEDIANLAAYFASLPK